jgi:hypothetical protein
MGIYPLLLLAATAVGFLLRPHRVRMQVAGTLASMALFVLLAQIGIGFPAERKLHAALTRPDDSGDERAALAASLAFDVHYTPWLWLGLLLNVAAVLVLVVEWFATNADYRWGRPEG